MTNTKKEVKEAPAPISPRRQIFENLPKGPYKIIKIPDPEGSKKLFERIRKASEYTEEDRLRF